MHEIDNKNLCGIRILEETSGGRPKDCILAGILEGELNTLPLQETRMH
jgi:hypothetical protein